MGNRYGIYQTSPKSCVFYKQDEDGNQSTFNIFKTNTEGDKEQIAAFIDNEGMKTESWSKEEVNKVEDVLDAFGGWAKDAPLMFELEAHKSIGQCLSSSMKKED